MSVAWKSGEIASIGQTRAHLPQEMQASASTTRVITASRPITPSSAPSGHRSRHHMRGSSHETASIAENIASTAIWKP